LRLATLISVRLTATAIRGGRVRPDVVQRYAGPVPRYTSYPTAPHFSPAVGSDTYAGWLKALPAGAALSVYVHIPFCDRLCWYCGCTTKATQQYRPVATYLEALHAEIRAVAGHVPDSCRTVHIHWGGGSPSILRPDDIVRLGDALRSNFAPAADMDFAVEVDPRNIAPERVAAFATAGVTRVSIGVQDFAPEVQKAIHREQSVDTTRRAVELFREAGVRSINIDLVYGLPHQTRDSVEDTIAEVISLNPDRIALFGYAHLPTRLPHQRMIPEAALPDASERFAQANRAAHRLISAGFQRVGLDHFARPNDALANGRVHRNFQGYTTDPADALIGLGASSIGRLPQGYIQNSTVTADYQRRIADRGLATVKGYALSDEDRARGFVIERLMCDLAFPADGLQSRFPHHARALLAEAEALLEGDQDGLVAPIPNQAGFRVTEKGRAFLRSICSCFDAYLNEGAARYSVGV
jgi:oxygen-independent coproporphyrinogen-3 oxidase